MMPPGPPAPPDLPRVALRIAGDGQWLVATVPPRPVETADAAGAPPAAPDWQPVVHPRVLALFKRSLHIDPDGSVTLRVGPDSCAVQVERTALFVERAAADGQGIRLTLSDGTSEPLDFATVAVHGDAELYCLVKPERIPARLLRAAYHELAARLVERPDGGYGLQHGRHCVPVRTLQRPPGPAAY